jgi:diguanylate cyclase (GGDEF)-like protein
MGTIAEATKVDRVYIWKNDIVDGRLHCTQVYEWSENVTPQQDNELTVSIPYSDVAPDWEEILSQGKCINSLVRDFIPETRDHLTSQGVVSILAVPVFLDNCFWGFVGFDDCYKERIFDEAEEMALRSISLLFAHAYQKNELAHEIEERNEFSRTMLLNAPVGFTIFDENLKPIDCNDTVLEMYGEPSKEYYLNNFLRFSPEYQPNGMSSSDIIKASIIDALRGRRVEKEWMHCTRDGVVFPTKVTLVGARFGNRPVALAYTYDLRQIKRLELDLDRIKNQVYLDMLTGIYNRRYFDETLEQIIDLLSRSNTVLSVLMIDIDYFKLYNDTYGHHGGDCCLRAVAGILSNCLSRKEEFVARFGGEEFVIVLPNTGESGARLIAENILDAVRNANIPHEGSLIADHLTVSIGAVSGFTNNSLRKDDYIIYADEMLYVSKQNGRDRYMFRLIDN